MKKVFILLFAIVILSIASVSAALTLTNATPGPNEVSVGVYIINLGKFDIATGTFTVDFYLDLKCSKNCSDVNFEFINGRANSLEKTIDAPNEKFYRIQANLNSPVDLKKFPFDSQSMQIIIEDKKNTIEELVFVPLVNESAIDDSIAFTGWHLDGWTAEAKEHEYPIYEETYSQYVFSIDISRVMFNSIIKTFLPIFFIVLVMLSSFVLDPDKIVTRLGMVGSALVASVMFHISIANQIPPVGYLTFADKFMVLTYFVVLLSFVFNVALLELNEEGKKELVEKVHRMTEFSMLIIVPLMYLILFLVLI
jgi:hypothetical protein